jgi:hypothetical protein
VSYRFVADDRIYTEEEPVRKELYHSLDEGQSLLVRYARGDPAVSTVEPGRVGGLLAITAFCLVWDGVVFTFSWYLVREIRKRRRLARRGRQIAGEVLGCDPDRDSDGDLWLTVRFGFHSPQTGRWIEGKGSHTRKDLEGKPLPPQGTPVKVLYLDDKTFMML